jgi:hypothetical protein
VSRGVAGGAELVAQAIANVEARAKLKESRALRGLTDRVEALDGNLRVESVAGAVHARVPLK